VTPESYRWYPRRLTPDRSARNFGAGLGLAILGAVLLSFEVAGDGTDVKVSGKVAQSAEKLADRAFWATTLTAV
jgi:hypothetical protein